MKQILEQYAAYNVWANQKLIDTIQGLPAEISTTPFLSSFATIHATLLHVWDAESIWWQRVKLHERFLRPSENFKGVTRDAGNGLLSQSKLWESWISNASDLALENVFEYRDSKKELNKMPVYQVITQVMNHGTYHRGQLVNMLRQLGVDKLPQTDFSVWVRKK